MQTATLLPAPVSQQLTVISDNQMKHLMFQKILATVQYMSKTLLRRTFSNHILHSFLHQGPHVPACGFIIPVTPGGKCWYPPVVPWSVLHLGAGVIGVCSVRLYAETINLISSIQQC